MPFSDSWKMQAFRSQLSPYVGNKRRILRKGPSLSGSETDISTSTENLTVDEKTVFECGVRQEPQGEETETFDICNDTLVVHHGASFDRGGSPFYGDSGADWLRHQEKDKYGQHCETGHSPKRISSPRYSSSRVQEITEIPEQYLVQSEVLKHLAKEVHRQTPSSLPPEYAKTRAARASVSRSHPDLTHMYADAVKPSQRLNSNFHLAADVDPDCPASQASKIIGILSTENLALKSELELYQKKVSRMQNFEKEIQKVHHSHEEVVQSTEKREKLERAIRNRLESEVRKLQEINRDLKEQLDATTTQLFRHQSEDADDSELRKELAKRDVLVAQLLSQSKELSAEKERQEAELHAQRATLQEQRNHIDILDNALNNAQANVVKLEEENRKKQAYVDRVAQLQRALANLQLASDRRLQMEKKIRQQLEKEIDTLRAEEPGKLPSGQQQQDMDQMKRTLRDYEEKIIALEAEVSKWEQRYLEESTMRQIEMDAASVPKDAKIAALERTSQESEKLIAQARTEKLRQMDELYAAQRKSAELEGHIKDLESKLAERNAMIRVLRTHSQEKDAVLQSAVLGRPPRHSRAASAVGLTPTSSLGTAGSSATLHCHKDDIDVSCSSAEPLDFEITTSDEWPERAEDADSTSRLLDKKSIMSALCAEKKLHPNHFWRV